MLKRISDDLYPYLKARWWGKALLVVIALGLLVFLIWQSLTPALKDSLLRASSITSVQENRGLVPDGQQKTFSEEEMLYRNVVVNTCRGIHDHKTHYERARELTSTLSRDDEYASLVVDAVCNGDERFALELFAQLSTTDMKDRAAKQATWFYVNKKQFADAQRWAALLTIPQDRDWWIHRILEESGKGG